MRVSISDDFNGTRYDDMMTWWHGDKITRWHDDTIYYKNTKKTNWNTGNIL